MRCWRGPENSQGMRTRAPTSSGRTPSLAASLTGHEAGGGEGHPGSQERGRRSRVSREVRRQRCSLYGETGVSGGRPETAQRTPAQALTYHTHPSSTVLISKHQFDGRQSKGKLDRTWPPPNPKSARENPGLTQEPKV
ncbi:hypothetical protein J4Q44_G00175150 [Coregonus suidteri]|uniref:Uncharacterized protein n=1 Tax=Coregonus suidteri TaxID=861788 RepID=A0AAN8M479_9TELE